MGNTCKTCKHWCKAGEYETGHGLGLGRCKNIPMFWDATDWSDDGEDRVIVNKYKNHKAFAQDGSDYTAFLLTKEEFGCVSYEAVED